MNAPELQKIKFIAHICIRFNQNIDEKSEISPKLEAVIHLYAVFLLSVEQRRRPIKLEQAMVYLDVIDVT